MKKIKTLVAVVAATVGASMLDGQASAATVINFDDGVAGTAVGNTYSSLGVTFSGASFASNFSLVGSSGALGINSTSQGFIFGPDNPIVGQFASLVADITIRGVDVGQAGVRLEAYDTSNTLVSFDEFFGPGIGVGTFHDLTVAGSGIASFRVFQPLSAGGNNAFGDGVLFDNLSFDVAASTVPEPSTLALICTGVLGLGVVGRRKRV